MSWPSKGYLCVSQGIVGALNWQHLCRTVSVKLLKKRGTLVTSTIHLFRQLQEACPGIVIDKLS